jgi:diacylglycerol kinase (ATP)
VSVTPLQRGPDDDERERPTRRAAQPAPGRAPSLLESFNYALEGIIHVLRTQRNLRIHFLAAVVVFAAAVAVGVTRLQLIALVLAIAFVLVAEMLNTAIEGVIDVSTTSFDPNAKLAKDIAAGAVLIASITALGVGYLVFESAAGTRATQLLDRVRNGPATVTLAALVLVVLVVIATKAWTGRGTPLRGGLPSGHAALAFSGWVAVTYLIEDQHRFVVSSLTLIMALLVAQTRVESGVHSFLEVVYGGALGALVTLVVFQFVG